VIDEDVKSEASKIEDALEGVDGIGTKNKQNAIDAFVRYDDFERASASKLTDIRGIGSQTAENIIDAR
jgi:excinuclease UvrABC nuclease subunit